MSADPREASVAAFLDGCVASGDVPSAAATVREAGREVLAVAVGDAVVVPRRIAATVDTIYDLASLTKPLVTALLVAMEVEAGRISYDDPIGAHVSELDRSDKRRITLGQLLSHSSGLPKWVPFYVDPGDPSRVVDSIAAMPFAYEPGTRVVYSDPNYVTLGIALERSTGQPLDALFVERIANPLGLVRTGFRPDPSLRDAIAASETGNAYERSLAGGAANGYDGWRTDVLWGEVHDGNAAFLGGVAGHAGLFGPVREVARLAEQFLPGSALLSSDETFAAFRTNATPGLDEHRSMGWMLASTPDSSAGPAMPPDAFGHTGFTGTSVWIDPVMRRVVVLLTNRTHPIYATPPMTAIRRRMNELAAGL